MLARLDYPPVWLIAFMAGAWALAPVWAPLGGVWAWIGVAVAAASVALAVWAALAFRRAGTTIVPGREPAALVEDGPYRFSRNPIYLADLGILAGWSLWLGTPLGLLLVWPLKVVLERRFVLPEESVLARDLGRPYLEWKARVRRWV